MQKVDLKKELKHLYNPSAKEISVVDVPEMNFLMVDGEGDPNTSQRYRDALEALYAVSYTLKFMLKKGEAAIDYPIMASEGLWWADDMTEFSAEDKAAWKWTMMIMHPGFVTGAMVDEAQGQVEKKKGPLPALPEMRFESFREGPSAQILYIGPYSAEGPTIRRLHEFIAERDHERRGKHHEIYLGDPRRTAPERLRTVLRQPFGRSVGPGGPPGVSRRHEKERDAAQNARPHQVHSHSADDPVPPEPHPGRRDPPPRPLPALPRGGRRLMSRNVGRIRAAKGRHAGAARRPDGRRPLVSGGGGSSR